MAHHNTLMILSNIMQKKSCQLPHEKVDNFFLFMFLFLILLHFLHQINLCGKVVGVTIEPYACCMRTERTALELAILLK